MAVFNDDTMQNVLDNYGDYNDTLAQSKYHTEQMTVATQELNHAQSQSQQTTNQTTQATAEQTEAQEQLVARYRSLQTVIPELHNKMAEMEMAGNKNSVAYAGLAKQLETVGQRLESLKEQVTAQGWEGTLLTDIEKASAAFEALGLDADEFATGLNSKTTTALNAFIEVARLAKGDVHKLAQAYTAAQSAAGDNAQAQALLEQKLLQATEGNKELAESIKQTALAQQNVKSATDAQSQALQALGINMDAINQKMSASGLEMVSTLKAGVTAIKEQATSAESLKTALGQALDTSMAAAKTQADFKAIKAVIDDVGVAGKVTVEQMAKINAGANGGSDAVQKLADTTKAHTATVANNTQATVENTNAKADNAKASEDITKAEAKAEQASTSRLTTYTRYVPAWIATIEQQISKLQELGATQEQVTALTEKMHHKMSIMPSASIYQMAQSSARLSKELSEQTAQFNRTKSAAEYWAKALNGAEISSNDLAKAQLVLKSATNASINGIVRMDNQTLSGLQSSIDGTRRKMRDLANDAKTTADSLEATLAKMQGNENKAREIEQSKKLNELQDKLNAAKKRGNSEEVKELNRALELQRKINSEEDKQAKRKIKQAYDKQLNEQNKLISKQEADIAKMTDDDELALKIAQQQKLWDMQDEMAKAQASNNADAIANAKHLLQLRQQADAAELEQLQEKLKKQTDKQAQKEQQQQAKAEKERIVKERVLLDSQAKLAKASGDTVEAVKIEQKKKLLELESQLATATANNHEHETKRLSDLIKLQEGITERKIKQAEDHVRKSESKSKPSDTQTRTSTPSITMPNKLNIGINAKDVANAWDKRITELVEKSLKDFMQQLRTEANRLAR